MSVTTVGVVVWQPVKIDRAASRASLFHTGDLLLEGMDRGSVFSRLNGASFGTAAHQAVEELGQSENDFGDNGEAIHDALSLGAPVFSLRKIAATAAREARAPRI